MMRFFTPDTIFVSPNEFSQPPKCASPSKNMFFVINSYVFRASHTHRPQCSTGAEMAILRWFYNVFWKAIITTPSDRPSESSICNIRFWRHLSRNIDIFEKNARKKNMHFSLRVLFLSAQMNLRRNKMSFSFDFLIFRNWIPVFFYTLTCVPRKVARGLFCGNGNITLVLQRILNVRVETSLALDGTNYRQPIIYDSTNIAFWRHL